MTEALQDRRRRQTGDDIRAAALRLFEEHGVDGTTVDDIADAAGVSARTVFRYASTKERTVLIPDPATEAEFDASLARLRPSAPLVPQLAVLWRDMLVHLEDGRSEAGRQALRLWRLIPQEPALLLAAIAVDEERLVRAESILENLGIPAPTGRVALETSAAVVRVALDHWARAPEGRELAAAVDESFRSLREHTRSWR